MMMTRMRGSPVVLCRFPQTRFAIIQISNSGKIYVVYHDDHGDDLNDELPSPIFILSQGLRGSYWVLYNYIKGEKQFQVTKIYFFL